MGKHKYSSAKRRRKRKQIETRMMDDKGHRIAINSVIVDWDTKEAFYVYSKDVICGVLNGTIYTYKQLKDRYLKVYHKPSFKSRYE